MWLVFVMVRFPHHKPVGRHLHLGCTGHLVACSDLRIGLHLSDLGCVELLNHHFCFGMVCLLVHTKHPKVDKAIESITVIYQLKELKSSAGSVYGSYSFGCETWATLSEETQNCSQGSHY